MDKLIIEGGVPLKGTVDISGSKNAALPILMACILTRGCVELSGVPRLADIRTTLKLLNILGCQTWFEGDRVRVQCEELIPHAPYELVKTMRASVLCLGPLLALLGEAKVALPGGCAIGARPVDQHLRGLERMGATFVLEDGYITGECKRLTGARIPFDMVTVGGTEHLMMAAAMAEGETILENAAREPEVSDLANFLNACGAKIEGHGTSVIRIQGVERLAAAPYRVMSDRIEAGTYMVAAAITGGELTLEHCPLDCLDAVADKMRRMGVDITDHGEGRVTVAATGGLKAVDISTRPHPGFPTDMQAQLMALLCLSEGAATVEENIFENRFMHVMELSRMGADIQLKGRAALVRGVKKLTGAPVMASDLRASASLVLAGLAAEKTTEVQRIYHLDRGYERIEDKLSAVGARIRREKD